MEFKGTKELQLDLRHNQVLNNSGVLVIANVNDYNGEGKYNALLYYNAYKLLEAMQEFCERVDNGEVRSVKTYNKFKQLIKQSTEL